MTHDKIDLKVTPRELDLLLTGVQVLRDQNTVARRNWPADEYEEVGGNLDREFDELTELGKRLYVLYREARA